MTVIQVVQLSMIKMIEIVKYSFLALSELGLVKTEEEQKIRDEGYKRHAFNVLISNKLSYHRSIPDTRNKL